MSFQRDRGAGDDHCCADVATHGVKRYTNLLRHECPGNLIPRGPCATPAASPATDGESLATPDPGRDNTVSRPRHNLLTPISLWRRYPSTKGIAPRAPETLNSHRYRNGLRRFFKPAHESGAGTRVL